MRESYSNRYVKPQKASSNLVNVHIYILVFPYLVLTCISAQTVLRVRIKNMTFPFTDKPHTFRNMKYNYGISFISQLLKFFHYFLFLNRFVVQQINSTSVGGTLDGGLSKLLMYICMYISYNKIIFKYTHEQLYCLLALCVYYEYTDVWLEFDC